MSENLDNSAGAYVARKSGTDWINDALRHREGARTASHRIARQISAIAQLYGDALGHVLTLAHEDLAEHASEEAYAWERAYQRMAERRELEARESNAAISVERVTVARLAEILHAAIDYETAPRRARRDRPAWTAAAAQALDDLASEPF